MIFRIFQFGSFLLIVWLTFQLSSIGNQLSVLRAQNQNQLSFNKAQHAEQSATAEKIDQLKAGFDGIKKQQAGNAQYKNKLASYKKQQQKVSKLRQTYIMVLEAEALRATGDAKQAIQKLKSSKKPIWTSGDAYPKHKKKLQGLMQSIDATLASWKKNDLKKNTKPIYSAIATVLRSQGELK